MLRRHPLILSQLLHLFLQSQLSALIKIYILTRFTSAYLPPTSNLKWTLLIRKAFYYINHNKAGTSEPRKSDHLFPYQAFICIICMYTIWKLMHKSQLSNKAISLAVLPYKQHKCRCQYLPLISAEFCFADSRWLGWNVWLASFWRKLNKYRIKF